MQVTKAIKIDLVEKGVQPIVYAKQNDSQTRFIASSLFANGQPFSVPDGVIAMFRAGKPDGTACFYDSNETGTPAITIEGNLVTVELAEQVLTAPGNVQAEINFYTAGGEKLTSFSFAIQVEKSVLTDQEIVSSDYYNVLTAQITAAQDAAQTAQTAAQKAQSYAGQAEETLQEVEQLADTVSGTIQQAGQEQVAAVQQAGQTQVSSVTQAGQEQITAVQQAGAQQTAAAAAEADRAKGYADSIDPSQFVKTVNGEEPDASGNVEVQAGVASVFGRTGAVTAQDGDYDAGQIDETSSRVFVSPQEKAKWSAPGDLINGTLSVWQRYNADDSTTYTNPDELYVADRFRSNGTGTVKPNARGYGADITGTVTMQYWMEKSDFALLPDPVVVYYSVGGEMQSTSTAKASVQTDSDGNACVFSRAITNQTLDWVSLYPGRPVRPYAEELALCQRYAVIYRVKNGSTFLFPGYGINATSSRFTAQLPTPMRTKPTVTGTSLTAGASAPDEQAHNLSGVTVAADAGNTLMVQGTTSGLTAGRLYFLRIVNGGYMLLDAEIY